MQNLQNFKCSLENAVHVLAGAFENNGLCKIWGGKQSVLWGDKK